MKKIIKYSIAAIAFFVLVNVWGYVRDSKLGAITSKAVIIVSDTTSVEGVIHQLKSQSSIKHEKALRNVFARKRVAEFITPGYYEVSPSASAVYIARMLNNSWQTPVRLTLSGSLRLKSEIAQKISSKICLDEQTLLNAFNDKAFLKNYGVTPNTMFSIILPDTYEIYWDASLDDLFSLFRREYEAFWTEERLAKAKALKLTPLQVSIIASIVRCESNYVPEYKDLAGVYLNRLNRGMKLQACPTVAFCYDFKLTRVLNKHLKVDSPYNTYIHKGLPPGPICCPTKEAIDAVLNANTASGYLYFCASTKTPGRHLFAKTYAQHSKNAKEFQRVLDSKTKK